MVGRGIVETLSVIKVVIWTEPRLIAPDRIVGEVNQEAIGLKLIELNGLTKLHFLVLDDITHLRVNRRY